jgi:hypothetical protein
MLVVLGMQDIAVIEIGDKIGPLLDSLSQVEKEG